MMTAMNFVKYVLMLAMLAGFAAESSAQYTHWVYLDFQNAVADSVNIVSGDPLPDTWDIAVHRYDTKTNGGAVAMTSDTDIDDYADSGEMPDDDVFVEDIWTEDVIAIDMSGMMQGKPIYTKSDNVFVLKLQDGRHIALKLENYMDGSGTKGYMTIQYRTLDGNL